VLLTLFNFSSPWLIFDLLNKDLSEPLLIQVNPMCIETETPCALKLKMASNEKPFLYEAYWRYLYNTDKNFREDINMV